MTARLVVGLTRGYPKQRRVGDGFDEAVAQRVQRGARGVDRLRPRKSGGEERRHALLNLRVDGAVLDERAAGRVNEDRPAARGAAESFYDVAGAKLRDLADRARHRVLVALAAGLRVVDGPQPVLYLVHLREDELVGLEGAGRRGRARLDAV